MPKLSALWTLTATLAITGCAGSFLNPRPAVIEDKLGKYGGEKVGTLATAADYRVVYVRLDSKKDKKEWSRICAEPSPDAAAEFSSALAGNIKDNKTQIDAGVAANMAAAMQQLFHRSQGVQFYRDGSFALCNMYMNDVISKPEYLAAMNKLLEKSSGLIEKEVATMDQPESVDAKVPSSNASVDLSEKSSAGAKNDAISDEGETNP